MRSNITMTGMGLRWRPSSRKDNPGVRIEIDYQADAAKSYVYEVIAPATNSVRYVKVTGVQKDGLEHTEEEVEYNTVTGAAHGKKLMVYDNLGRMVAMTDPDAKALIGEIMVNGVNVIRYDKTWVIKYDDLGRQSKVLYPQNSDSTNPVKFIYYNDVENSITTVDPTGRKLLEKRDWSGNVTTVTA